MTWRDKRFTENDLTAVLAKLYPANTGWQPLSAGTEVRARRIVETMGTSLSITTEKLYSGNDLENALKTTTVPTGTFPAAAAKILIAEMNGEPVEAFTEEEIRYVLRKLTTEVWDGRKYNLQFTSATFGNSPVSIEFAAPVFMEELRKLRMPFTPGAIYRNKKSGNLYKRDLENVGWYTFGTSTLFSDVNVSADKGDMEKVEL